MISPFYRNLKNAIRIHIFKTNIETKLDVDMLQLLFSSNRSIINWSVDLEDIDNVLRIEASKNLSENEIITQLNLIGFSCEELD
ncbi:hypothetical protein H8K90_10425 [Winogradskyella echinorum]|uniref:Uncharacterized protein n=1 Tax=Winogradskyella echinorum TaxID=538189 RepID=A0ABR6Y256_9FLAO|nr:hypothetical protein [Winogradskyella echinorum]MBC3846795.1 hypothetical protein [Winogradskyella echinorum]MBC5751143.1 hypothetical protein [Winogradskyella echinorum]